MIPQIARRWRSIVVAFALVVGTTGLIAPSAQAATAGTKPPASTQLTRTAALVEPSMAFLNIEVSAGTVDVPWGDNTTHKFDIDSSNQIGDYCSASVITADGMLLSAGHCEDPAEYYGQMIDAVYQYLKSQTPSQIPAGLTEDQVEDPNFQFHWTVEPDSVQLTTTVSLMANASSVGTAQELTASSVIDEPIGQGDLSLIKVDLPSTVRLPVLLVAPSTPVVGASIVSDGFPGVTTYGEVNEGNSALTPTPNPGSVVNLTNENGIPFTAVSAQIEQGMSGGPTVNATDGSIVGVNSHNLQADAQDTATARITDTTRLRAFLASNQVVNQLGPADVAWRTGLADYWKGLYREAVAQFNLMHETEPNNFEEQYYLGLAQGDEHLESSGLPLWVWAAMIIGAVLVVAAAAFVLLRRRRDRRRGTPPESPSREAPTVPQPTRLVDDEGWTRTGDETDPRIRRPYPDSPRPGNEPGPPGGTWPVNND